MKTASSILLATFAFTGWVAADLPAKAPLTKYRNLWDNSPFTSKPPPPDDVPESNPLEDYALGGVSPISGGYRVTLLNKKKPEERITVDSDSTKSGFKIIAVTRKTGDPLGTVVRMSSGALTGTVSFDEKLLTIAPPPAAAKQPPQPGQPQVLPGMPQLQPGQIPPRQPRPRVVPPPAPQVQPQVQPQQQGQPSQSGTRTDRRDRR